MKALLIKSKYEIPENIRNKILLKITEELNNHGVVLLDDTFEPPIVFDFDYIKSSDKSSDLKLIKRDIDKALCPFCNKNIEYILHMPQYFHCCFCGEKIRRY